MESKREELIAAIEQQLQHAIDLFYAEIGSAFQPLRAFCAAERKRYDPLLQQVREVEKTLRRAERPSWRVDRLGPSRLLLGFCFGRVLLGQALLGLAAGDDEVVVVAVVPPRAGRHVAHFHELPIG